MAVLWSNKPTYLHFIIMPGPFHFNKTYIKDIFKKLKGSGIIDIITESSLNELHSINGILSATLYSKSLYTIKVLAEALERLLLDIFVAQNEVIYNEIKDSLKKFASDLKKTSPAAMLNNSKVVEVFAKYEEFKQDVRNGSLGKTAVFWISIVDHCNLAIQLDMAIKLNDFTSFKYVINAMIPLFFGENSQNYARYMSHFICYLEKIEEIHPGATNMLKQNGLSVARSNLPGTREACDKTMEETGIKTSKSRGGAGGSIGYTGILTNPSSFYKWVRTMHVRTEIHQATLQFAGLKTSKRKHHKDIGANELKHQEKDVNSVYTTIKYSFLNPFYIDDKEEYYILT